MSIANEITRLQTAKSDLKAAIESKGVTVGDGTIDTYAEKVNEIETGGGYDQGYEDGKNSVIDIMFYAENIPSFKNAVFPDNTELIINIPRYSKGNASGLTLGDWNYTTGLKMLKLISNVEITDGIVISTSFNSSSIEELDLSEFPRWFKNILSGFMNCRQLKKIVGELDFTNTTFNGYEFYNCEALEELYIKQGTLGKSLNLAQSSKLNNASKQSIFNGLAVVDTAQTLTLHKSLKILQSQVDSANAKGWTVAGGTVVSEEEYYA